MCTVVWCTPKVCCGIPKIFSEKISSEEISTEEISSEKKISSEEISSKEIQVGRLKFLYKIKLCFEMTIMKN